MPEDQVQADEELVGVYYSSPWLPDWPQLATMLLTFDKVLAPHTYLPLGEYDPNYSLEKFNRGVELLRSGQANLAEENDQIRLNMYRAAAFAPLFQGIWEYNCESPRVITKENGLGPIADQLELATRGPRKPNWHPRFTAGLFLHVGEEGVPLGEVPGRYYYSAGALLYAMKRGIPLLHDDPEWIATLPGEGGQETVSTEDIAHKLMLRSLEYCVPRMHELGPYEILELRNSTRDLILPFRREMRRMAYDLRTKLAGADAMRDIEAEVNEHVTHVIRPLVHDIRRQLSEPTKPWYRWIQDPLQTAATFGIAGCVLNNPALIGFLSGGCKLAMDISDAQSKRKEQRSAALYYLVHAENS